VKGTAFGLDAAATAAASAVAAGIKPGEELTKYLKEIGDSAAVAGTSFEDMGSIFNKIQTQNKAFTDDLQQLSDRGLPIFTWLQEEYGVTADKLSDMVQKGQVDAAHFEDAINTHIGGAAQKMGQSFEGAVDNLEASLARLGANFITAALGGASGGDALAGPTQAITNLTGKFDELGAWVAAHKDEIHGFFEDAKTVAIEVGSAVKDISTWLVDNKGAAETLAGVFAGWKVASAVLGVVDNLKAMSTLLRVTLPGDALAGAGGISTALAGVALPAWVGALTDLASVLFQENHARDDDNAHGRTAELPVGPHGLPVGVKPGPPPGYGNGTAAPQNQPPAATNDIPSRGRFPAPNSPVLPGAAVAPPPDAAPALQWPGGPVPGAPINPLHNGYTPGTGVPSVAPSAYGLPAGSSISYGAQGFPDWVYQVANYFGIKPSTYAGHQETDRKEAGFAPNPGHENRAIDWSGPVANMQRFADHVAKVPGMEQVIFDNPQTGQLTGIAGGNDVSQTAYYASDYGGHTDHVHTRQSEPIPLPRSTGGGVWGAGTATSDSIPAMLSNGEHVLTADDVNAMGGQGGVYGFRNWLHRADGGAVDLRKLFKDGDLTGLSQPVDPNTTQHGLGMGAAPGPVGADGQPTDAQPANQTGDARTQGYIPSGAGSNSVAGTSFVSGLLNMGAEAINGAIDQAASAASTAASVGAERSRPGGWRCRRLGRTVRHRARHPSRETQCDLRLSNAGDWCGFPD
jgi:tape measure domain-containing protein